MPKTAFKEQINESLLDKGLTLIIRAFTEQKKEYKENISLLKSEIKQLKEENFIYKNKLTNLQQKLNSLSKTVLLLDEEVENKKNEKEKTMMKSLNNEFNLRNKNTININENNIISRNNKSTLFKNTSIKRKKFQTNVFDEENKKINSVNYNNKLKKTYSNNIKNLKYTINNQERMNYIKSLNYLNDSYIDSNSEIDSNNSEKKGNKKNSINGLLKQIDLKGLEISEDNNNSILYKKLNIFLDECKNELKALDFEKILNLLKSLETDSDIEIKNNIRKIIYNNDKLCELFDDIFEE